MTHLTSIDQSLKTSEVFVCYEASWRLKVFPLNWYNVIFGEERKRALKIMGKWLYTKTIEGRRSIVKAFDRLIMATLSETG